MECFNDYVYRINDDQEIVIVRYQGNEEMPVLPTVIDGLPVTEIGKHAFAASGIIEIAVPEGIRTIDTEAFGICECLESVTLPHSLKELGTAVFKGCSNLKQLSFPQGNERYMLDDGVLFDQTQNALVLCPPGLEYERYVVPYGTETISSAAFFMNRKLQDIRFPESLKKIEAEAFLFTDMLSFVVLPAEITEIAPDSFLLIKGSTTEKRFAVYAFPDTPAFRYAQDNSIPVFPLYAKLVD